MWQKAESSAYKISTLERLVEQHESKRKDAAHNMMKVQYRMHPDLAEIVSNTFYDGHLQTAPVCHETRSREAPVVFIDVPGKEQRQSYSYCNPEEVKMVVQVCGLLFTATCCSTCCSTQQHHECSHEPVHGLSQP
jgi:superfamily I DNA and/or RNA helicase